MMVIVASELLLYTCFSVLIGSFLLAIVSPHRRPNYVVAHKFLIAATIGIPVFSFIPVLSLMMNLSERIGAKVAIQTVLLQVEIGKAWLFTLLVSILLIIFISVFYKRNERAYAWIGIMFTFILIIAMAWTSHASALEEIQGMVAHIAHVTAMSSWVGVLLVVGWLSRDYSNWLQFLKWFTPLAVSCFIVITVSGLLLMSYVMNLEDYAHTWIFSYGTSLLLKHLFIVPVLMFAAVNGFFMKKKLTKDVEFNPLPWVRAESVVLLIIFSITAFLGQQSPPYEFTEEQMSRLFAYVNNGQGYVDFALNGVNMAFFGLAFLFLIGQGYLFFRKAAAGQTFVMVAGFVISSYLALVWSV